MLYFWICIYVLSVIFCHYRIYKVHKDNGRWSNIDASFLEIIVIFIPIANLVFGLMCYTNNSYNKIANKFFNIKK